METPKLLVVDDDPILRRMLRSQLERLGYPTPLEAADGETGLRLAILERPQLIFLDVVMPGLGGVVVLQCLRRHPATARIPVIVVTAGAVRETIVRLAQYRIAGCLVKPIDSELLSRALREAGVLPMAGPGRSPG